MLHIIRQQQREDEMARTIKQSIEYFTEQRDVHERALEKWAAQLGGGNYYWVLQNSKPAFVDAARWHVAHTITAWLTKQPRTMAEQLENVRRCVDYTSVINFTTSPTVNLAEAYEREAWMRALNWLEER